MRRSNSSNNFSSGSYASHSYRNSNSQNLRNIEECQYNDIPEMANFEEQLANWHLPKVKPSEIYSVGMFDFKMALIPK